MGVIDLVHEIWGAVGCYLNPSVISNLAYIFFG